MSAKQTAIVTGASQGIGAALVEALLNADYNVVATSRNINQALTPSSNLVLVAGDIGKQETATKVSAAAIENFGTIDLLVTDVVMPQLGGADLARELEQRRPDMKVLFLSGYTNQTLESRGVLRRPARLLQKPFTLEELIGAVDRASRRES